MRYMVAAAIVFFAALFLAMPALAMDLRAATSPDGRIKVVLTNEKCSDPTAPANVFAARVYIGGALQAAACYAELEGDVVMVVIEDGRVAMIPQSEFKPVKIRSKKAVPQKQSTRGPGTFGVAGTAI